MGNKGSGRPRSFRIFLSENERKKILSLKRKKGLSFQAKVRLNIILAADETKWKKKLSYDEIAIKAGSSKKTVIDTLRKYCTDGIEAAITPKRNPNSDIGNLKVTGDVEAYIIAKACSSAPEGYSRWTTSLLAEALYIVLDDNVTEALTLSRSTINRALNRNHLRPHLNDYWCIPPEEDAEFVAAMERVLDVYHRPYNPDRPVFCIDEKPYQILGDSREPLPMRIGDIQKIDSEYVRNGTVSITCIIEPHSGRIEHFVKPTRTAVDFAEHLKFIADDLAPDAELITLVMDNLNTHSDASLYKAFEPHEARRIARRFEFVYTPKHGSWLDIAEIGLCIMTRECLERRIPSIEVLEQELSAWNNAYRAHQMPINWQFSLENARIKLKRLYPDIDKFRSARDELAASKFEKVESSEENTMVTSTLEKDIDE